MSAGIEALFRRVEEQNRMNHRAAMNAQESQTAGPTWRICPAIGERISAEDCSKHRLMVSGVCDRCNYKSIDT